MAQLWLTLPLVLMQTASWSQELPEPSPGPEPSIPELSVMRVQAYVDNYLIDDADLTSFLPSDFGTEPLGRRYLDLEFGYYDADDDFLGDESEQGVRTRWGRETLNWGSFDFEILLADVEREFRNEVVSASAQNLTLRSSDLPVSARLVLDTTLGHQRSLSTSLLHGGYRFRLPSSLLRGISANLQSDTYSVRFATGSIGAYQGVRMPRFTDTGGRLTTVSFDKAVADTLVLGAEFAGLNGDDDIRDHSGMIFGLRQVRPDEKQEHASRFMFDGDGHLALWSDSLQQLGTLTTLRYGVFRFDTDIVWADRPIASDQQGIYFRADTGNARLRVGGGYDFSETGISDASVSVYTTHTAFFSTSMKVRRDLSFGANASLSDRAFSRPFSDIQTISRVNLFTSIRRSLGLLRLDLFANEVDSSIPISVRERNGVATSFSWDMPERIRLSTELRLERNLDQRGRTRRSELTANFHYSVLDNLSLGLNAGLYETRGTRYMENNGVTMRADVAWRFLPNWQGSSSLDRNTAEVDASDPIFGLSSDRRSGKTSLWVSVNYQERSGQAFSRLGWRDDGVEGSGRLSGQVFFDENRDGEWQPGEQVAAGVTVLLDERYETRTDELGFYTFAPVMVGEHEIIVLTEELPLPWGLDDERPRIVRVGFRSVAVVDFALTIMD